MLPYKRPILSYPSLRAQDRARKPSSIAYTIGYSIGFKLGEYRGYIIVYIPCSINYSRIILAMQIEALSYINIQPSLQIGIRPQLSVSLQETAIYLRFALGSLYITTNSNQFLFLQQVTQTIQYRSLSLVTSYIIL